MKHPLTAPRIAVFVLCATALIIPVLAVAAWPTDPATDLFIGDGPGEQAVPHLVAAADGACYAGWYTNASGNYDLAVQRLDAQGNEVWQHNGLLASDQPQDTWVMDWDLAAAGEDAITAVRDIRTGNPTVTVNRITAAGAFPWGAEGIVVASNSAFIGPPKLAVLGDGDVAVVWEEHPDFGDDTIRLQRIAPDGTLRYAAGGLVLHGTATEMPGRPRVIASGASDLIAAWVINDSFSANRQVAVQKFDSAGAAVWIVPITVFDGGSLPFGHDYLLKTDTAEGALVAWESGSGLFIYSYIQHLDADGQWLFPYGGLRVTTDDSYSEVTPQICYDAGNIFAFWTKTNGNQNQFGLQGQKFSAAGDRLWGAAGATFRPVTPERVDFLTASLHPAGITLAWTANETGAWAQESVKAMLVDLDGMPMWNPTSAMVASTLSSKGNLRAVGADDGSTRMIWKDERSGTPDMAAKSVNVDGSLGGGTVSIDGGDEPADTPAARLALDQNFPNPFNPATTIAFSLARSEQVRLTVHDLHGRLVRTLIDGARGEGRHSVIWAGETDRGGRAASGGYLYRLQTESKVLSRTMILTK